jgi:hypothetical protein
MKRLIALVALGAIACTTAPEQGSSNCRADGLGNLVGRERTSELGAEALRRSGARQLRWIRPGDAVTMDYQEDRLNIYLDARGRVERFQCG